MQVVPVSAAFDVVTESDIPPLMSGIPAEGASEQRGVAAPAVRTMPVWTYGVLALLHVSLAIVLGTLTGSFVVGQLLAASVVVAQYVFIARAWRAAQNDAQLAATRSGQGHPTPATPAPRLPMP